MAEELFDPHEFGIKLERDAFVNLMVEDFVATFRGVWMIDELLHHPLQARNFCEEIRRKHKFRRLPDDLILRSISQRRKGLW